MGREDGRKEKRKSVRVPVGFDLLYKIAGSEETRLPLSNDETCTHMFDLSEGGMAIWTHAPLAIGTQMDIIFHVIFKERQTPPMKAKGEVVYCIFLEDKKRYRLGIRFTQIRPQDRACIAELAKIKLKENK